MSFASFCMRSTTCSSLARLYGAECYHPSIHPSIQPGQADTPPVRNRCRLRRTTSFQTVVLSLLLSTELNNMIHQRGLPPVRVRVRVCVCACVRARVRAHGILHQCCRSQQTLTTRNRSMQPHAEQGASSGKSMAETDDEVSEMLAPGGSLHRFDPDAPTCKRACVSRTHDRWRQGFAHLPVSSAPRAASG